MSEIKKVVLAYSGGLDTSIIIPWLKENYGNPEIIAVSGDVGQGTELDGLEEKAIKTGASKLYVEDLVDEMVDEVIIPSLQMGAKYEDYLLGTAFARPIIARRLVEIAKAEGADAICHGCTGKGNDQVRFELAIKRFAPEMKIIAPWREWDIKGRDEEIDYAEAHNVPLKISRETNYSKDKNLWHLSHEGLDLEDPASEPVRQGGLSGDGRQSRHGPRRAYIRDHRLREGRPHRRGRRGDEGQRHRARSQRSGRRQRHRPPRHRGEPAGGHEGPGRV